MLPNTACALAKKHRVRTAWGTDILFQPGAGDLQVEMLTRMARWYTPAQVLKMAPADNAELLALWGPRSPCPGTLGVVKEGALADLLLVNGDPLSDLKSLEKPAANLAVIVKDGVVYKSTIR